jgi:hypothetical protein
VIECLGFTSMQCYVSGPDAVTSVVNGKPVTVRGRIDDQTMGIISIKDCSLVHWHKRLTAERHHHAPCPVSGLRGHLDLVTPGRCPTLTAAGSMAPWSAALSYPVVGRPSSSRLISSTPQHFCPISVKHVFAKIVRHLCNKTQ